MSAIQEFTLSEVSGHTSKEDLYIVLSDKVYDCSSFIQEHPGGEEVLLDFAGQDASDAFKDIGHSNEAHDLLNGLLVGTLKRQPGDTVQSKKEPLKPSAVVEVANSGGVSMYRTLLIGVALTFVAYFFL